MEGGYSSDLGLGENFLYILYFLTVSSILVELVYLVLVF